MKPQVSIITPVYNQEKYMVPCVESVLNQTYKDWEMIIVDDASIDKTFDIASSFAKKDKRIRIIRHKTNCGIKKLKNTYNQALKQAKGNLIAILEGDDFWPKYKLKTQIKAFDDASVVLSYGKWAMTNRSGKIIYFRDYKNFNKNLLTNHPPPQILKLYLSLQFDIGSQTVMIKKNTLLQMGGFKADKYYPFTDIPTYINLALKGRFAYIPMTLGFYRRTKKSSWFEFASQSKMMGREEMKECVNNFIKTKAKTFSKTLNWQDIERDQNKYLLKRRILRFPSIIFNKFLAK